MVKYGQMWLNMFKYGKILLNMVAINMVTVNMVKSCYHVELRHPVDKTELWRIHWPTPSLSCRLPSCSSPAVIASILLGFNDAKPKRGNHRNRLEPAGIWKGMFCGSNSPIWFKTIQAMNAGFTHLHTRCLTGNIMKHPGYPLFYLDGQRFKTPNLAGSSFLIDLTMAKHVPFADDMPIKYARFQWLCRPCWTMFILFIYFVSIWIVCLKIAYLAVKHHCME